MSSLKSDILAEYEKTEDHEKILRYMLDALNAHRGELSEDDPDLVFVLDKIGTEYGLIGEHESALEYHLKVMDIRLRTLPEDDPDILSSYDTIA